MTIKEAINFIIESNDVQWNTENKQAIEAMRIALDVLGKHERYQWHDLRKDPNDLPDVDTHIVYLFRSDRVKRTMSNTLHIHTVEQEMLTKRDDEFEYIAWKYIEPFEDQ